MTTQHGNTGMLIAAAVVGKSLGEIAAAAGISVSSVQRRLREPDIVAAITEGRTQQRAEATGRLAALRNSALDRLGVLVEDPDPGIALRAVSLVLGTSARFDAMVDFGTRLSALESPPEGAVVQPPGTDESGDDRAE